MDDDLALLRLEDSNLDLTETYNNLKLALFQEGRKESARTEHEDMLLQEALASYSKQISVPSLFTEMPGAGGFTPGLQPFPGLNPVLPQTGMATADQGCCQGQGQELLSTVFSLLYVTDHCYSYYSYSYSWYSVCSCMSAQVNDG